MNKRATGVMFCLIATLIYCTNYLVIATLGGDLDTLDTTVLNQIQTMIGNRLIYFSILALVIGFAYLLYAEIEAANKKDKHD